MSKTNILLKNILILFVVGLTITQVACGGVLPDSSGSTKSQVLESNKSRARVDDIPESDLEKLAEGNTTFSLALYHQLQSGSGNLFFSPYSISSALAMTYGGAKGETADEMAGALNFLLSQENLHPAFNALDQKLTSLAEIDLPEDQGDPFQLNIANALWGQKEFHFEDSFLDLLAENYGAGLRLLDYIAQPEESRLTINEWVSDQTEEKIKDLIPQGAINVDTRLVLSNAIYFKAAWLEQFQKELTESGIFYGLNGEEIQTQMMKTGSVTSFKYASGEGYQALELPYVGGQVSMLVLVPDQGQFSEFEDQFSGETLGRIVDELSYSPVVLTFPKFEFESEISLAQILADMGMPTSFSDSADFSGMTGSQDLFISDVFHKAYVGVDEEGTEAAAATAVVMSVTSAPESPLTLTVDRPFLFLIRESDTETVLFMGRVVNP